MALYCISHHSIIHVAFLPPYMLFKRTEALVILEYFQRKFLDFIVAYCFG